MTETSRLRSNFGKGVIRICPTAFPSVAGRSDPTLWRPRALTSTLNIRHRRLPWRSDGLYAESE